MRKGIIYYKEKRAGLLSEGDHVYEFIYDQSYLEEEDAMPVSLTLPLSEKPYRDRNLFPFFDGIIPEGWLLSIAQRNWKINPRDRMSDSCLICSEPLTVRSTGEYHGKCLEKLFGSAVSPRLPFSLDSLENLAAEVVRTHAAAVTGVQKKLSLSLEEDKSGKGQLTFVGLWGNFILKPPVHDYEQLPENELLTMNLAGKIGIDTVPHGLVRLTSGEAAYVTRRVDRIHRAGHYSVDDWEKIPMEDMCQLTERLTEHKYRGSLEQVGKVILKYCTNRIFDALRFYELILFCFLTGNGDMHLKNFSLITSKNGISLAPAYDLLNTRLVISDRDDPDDSALTLDGRRRRLEKKNFDNLAEKLELTSRQRDNVYKRFARKKEDILGMIGISRLSLELREQYEAIFRSRWDRLF